jgi:hypothetical protein
MLPPPGELGVEGAGSVEPLRKGAGRRVRLTGVPLRPEAAGCQAENCAGGERNAVSDGGLVAVLFLCRNETEHSSSTGSASEAFGDLSSHR